MPKSGDEFRRELQADVTRWRRELADVPADERFDRIRAGLETWIVAGEQLLAEGYYARGEVPPSPRPAD